LKVGRYCDPRKNQIPLPSAFGQFRLIANPIERLSSIATALTN
jgi:hypothetical protein